MNDRELLEAAAKAAGIAIRFSDDGTCQHAEMQGNDSFRYWAPWNPLADDGDALRLAVKLGITIDLVDKSAYRRDSFGNLVQEYWGGDYPDCYRLAIVRAAAATATQGGNS